VMFAIAIVIGVVHVNLGLIIGFVNELRNGLVVAFLRKGSWVLLEIAVLTLALGYGVLANLAAISWLSALPVIHVAFGWSLFCLALIGIWLGEGAKGFLETPMLFSNILSYLRLVALGLSSVFLALVVNEMAMGLFDKGGLWILVGIVILLVGHTINLVLGLLGPFLHSLRLHYVEWFTKFYEGGGKPYVPFGEVAPV